MCNRNIEAGSRN